MTPDDPVPLGGPVVVYRPVAALLLDEVLLTEDGAPLATEALRPLWED